MIVEVYIWNWWCLTIVHKAEDRCNMSYSTKVDYIRTNLQTLEDTIQKKRQKRKHKAVPSLVECITFISFCDLTGTWQNDLRDMSGYEDL